MTARVLLARLLLSTSLALLASSADAQITPPTGPVLFCGVQADPAPTSRTVSVDGGPAVSLTVDATVSPRCAPGTTHSFTLPAAQFIIGSHTVTVTSTNEFGSTVGNTYAVVVGLAPGAFTITAALPPLPGGGN